jgi:hypothetical protein
MLLTGRVLWRFPFTCDVLLLCACSGMARNKDSWCIWWVSYFQPRRWIMARSLGVRHDIQHCSHCPLDKEMREKIILDCYYDTEASSYMAYTWHKDTLNCLLYTNKHIVLSISCRLTTQSVDTDMVLPISYMLIPVCLISCRWEDEGNPAAMPIHGTLTGNAERAGLL